MKHYFTDGTLIDFELDPLNTFEFSNLLKNLSLEGRFCNQVPWSVLQHSIAVGKACEMLYPGNIVLIQHGYLHDISEAIIRDVPTPIKKLVGNAWYNMEEEIQDKLLNYLHVSKLGDEDEDCLAEVDKTMAFVEACNFYSEEQVEYMKMQQGYEPEIIICCTTAFNMVHGIDIVDEENGGLSQDITDIYKQVIYATIM